MALSRTGAKVSTVKSCIFAVEALPAASTNLATTLPLAAIEDTSSAGTSTVQSVPLEVNATDV